MRILAAVALLTTGCAVSYPAMTPAQEVQLHSETHLDDLPRGRANEGDAVVRVIVSSSREANGHICTGSLVDRSMILTAGHCIENADAGRVRVELGGSYLPWGRVGVKRVHVCEDEGIDLAAIVTSEPVPLDVPILAMRGTGPTAGEPVARVGFGTGSSVRSIPLPGEGAAAIIQNSRVTRTGIVEWAEGSLLATDAEASYGDSGGPILGADGSIVAVATAIAERPDTDHRVTIGVLPNACPGLFEATLAFR